MKIEHKAKELLQSFLEDYEDAHVRVGQITIGSG